FIFQCAHLVEEYEEILEEYYYKHQSSNMTAWLCESRLEVCCPDGHYGKDCTKCPGLELSGSVCFAHGSCHGDGSRSGTGACKCDHGYSGNMCRKCAPDFFEKSKSENSIACEKCFDACAGGCTGAGPKACVRCRSGWTKTEEGCVDIDECEIEKSCTKANEKCVNEAGSFRCECVEGYKREGDECVLDVEASTQSQMGFIAVSIYVLCMILTVEAETHNTRRQSFDENCTSICGDGMYENDPMTMHAALFTTCYFFTAG
ncbi:hypothetical protein Angca_010160, partial [Angiostrongylus cantonensis]